MAGTMMVYPESPMDSDDVVYPCKGCGEILEEGKAFELAGHRWHLECFKCNTCGTVLDSDANLLLLGDGSLICNNCTYSCTACKNKIQDLAILTGDQAYCAGCFRCRNCKKKIENLRYARTSQGMFCMECHDALMARRRKKTKNATQRVKQQGGHVLYDKSLPSLPPNAAVESHSFSPESDRGGFSGPSTPTELPASDGPARRMPPSRTVSQETSETPQELDASATPATGQSDRNSALSDDSEGADGFFIPMAIDPSIVATPPVAPREDKSQEKENTPPGERVDYFNKKSENSSRRPVQEGTRPAAHRTDSKGSSQAASPRASLKETGRNQSDTRLDILGTVQPRGSAERSRDPSPLIPRRETEKDSFQLQEAPPSRKKSLSAKDTIFSGRAEAPSDNGEQRRPSLADQPRSAASSKTDTSSPMAAHPKRGDSLAAGKANTHQVIQRKEVGSSSSKPSSKNDSKIDYMPPPSGGKPEVDSPSSTYGASPGLNGGLVIGKPTESPIAKSFLDYPQRSDKRPSPGATGGDSFASPRAAPDAPQQRPRHERNKSSSMATPKAVEGPDGSPSATRMVGDADDKMDAEQEHSFLKRMSNSVRHARSHSDRAVVRGSRDGKGPWPKSPLNGSVTAELLSSASPSMSSPESAVKDAEYYKDQLRLMRQRNAEQDKKIAELREMMEGPKTTIKQMNTELREKRSTIFVLETQKEMVVRELELLQPMAAAKKSGESPDVSKVKPNAMKDFSSALQKLKDQFAPEIEELMEKKTSVLEDIARLTRERDRLQQEFDQLSLVNQRLIDATNENANARIAEQAQNQQAQGLGIFGPTGDRLRDMRPASSETQTTNSTLVQDLGQEEPVLMAPKVIDVRKGGNRAKFNWKKGGIVAKTVGKGLKDAFSTDRSQSVEQQGGPYAPPPGHLEGTPYGSVQSGAYPSTTLPKDYKVGEPSIDRQGGAHMFNSQKGRPGAPQGGRSTPMGAISHIGGEPIEPPHKLYGSLLQARADFEGLDIPSVVVRCVQEVQSRGMDVEGIYRKSGGSTQINEIKAGFEKSHDYDISDVDLDIHAVTSALKQYFRKLPNPLITFEVYDRLIATAPRAPVQPMMGGGTKGGENGAGAELMSKEERIMKTREALSGLPKAHGATLSFLIFHLAKIRREEARNLMHSLNLAVVFAPTIMRPVDIAREMSDTPGKNDCVRFLIENCEDLFLRG